MQNLLQFQRHLHLRPSFESLVDLVLLTDFSFLTVEVILFHTFVKTQSAALCKSLAPHLLTQVFQIQKNLLRNQEYHLTVEMPSR